MSSNVAGSTLTLPLLVQQRDADLGAGSITGAYAAATELAVMSLVVLLAMTLLGPEEARHTMKIDVQDVSKRFGEFAALDDVSLEVPEGSLTALLGPSGSGKSTLLRIIAGLEQPDSGAVLIDGEDVTDARPQDRGIGFVFQHYAAFAHMSVRENVAFGLQIRKRPTDEIRAKVDELLELVGLTKWAGQRPAPAVRAVSASGWRSPARWRSSRRCCCSTSRSARSTRTSAPSCAAGCAGCTTSRA